MGLLVLAGFALTAVASPSAAEAVKATAKLEFEVPAEGKVGFNHLVFKVKKKGKALSARAAKRAKKGSKKLDKKVRAKATLKGQGIPEDVQVAASVAQLKGQKRTYALDLAVAHADREESRSAPLDTRGAGTGDPHLLRADLTVLFFPGNKHLPPAGEAIIGNGLVETVVQAPNVTENSPRPPAACGPDGELADYGNEVEFPLNGDLLANLEELADFIALSELLLCGLPIPDDFEPLFDELGLDQPPVCTPDLSGVGAAPNGEFAVELFCREPMSRLTYELPGQRQVQDFVPMQNLPNCQPGTNVQNNNQVLTCAGGTLPRNVFDSVRVSPSSPLDRCDRITIYASQSGSPPNTPPAIVDTRPFAICP